MNTAVLAILSGLVFISFSGVMMPGPMFAVTLAKSFKSPAAGSLMALGHAVIEVPLILLIYFGLARFFQDTVFQLVLSFLGGGMVLWLGLGMLRSRRHADQAGKDLPYSSFVAGILMTGLNPFFLLWWATIGSLLILTFLPFGPGGLAAFIAVHWLCDFIWLSFVSVTVYKTHSLWGARVHAWIFTACGLLLAGFGVWFIVSGVRGVS
ncbi:MAG: LysE family transporter [Chloroflexi bacterium]|nr:LysE family transporter [Chloroflexota bacterium]